MSRTRILISLTGVVAFLGFLAIGYVFMASLGPSAKANLNQARVALSSLEIGKVVEVEAYGGHAFVLRQSDSKFLVLSVPSHWEAEYAMPDPTWRRAVLPCNDFGVIKSTVGNSVMGCRDPNDEDHWWKNLRWTLEGVSLTEWIPNLLRPSWQIDKEYLVIDNDA